MSWYTEPNRMQYQGLVSQACAASDELRNSSVSEISILPGFKDSVNGNTRVRSGVKVQPCSVLPIHDGSGDAQRAPRETHSGRALKARKSAQMEYKEQLDLQVAQQKQMRELERQKETQCCARQIPMCGPIVAQLSTSPPAMVASDKRNISAAAVPCWLIPSATSPMLIPDRNTLSPAPSPVGSPARNIIVTPSLPMESKSDPTCNRRQVRTNLYHDVVVGQLKNHAHGVEFDVTPPVAMSHSEPMLPKSMVSRQLVYADSPEEIDYHQSPAQKYSSTPNRNLGKVTEVEPCGEQWREMVARGTVYKAGLESNAYFPHGSAAVPVLLNPSEGGSVYSPSPPTGSSPCGSVYGETSLGDTFLGTSNVSLKQHISQTADQRPGTSVRNSVYQSALHVQIQERKAQEEERIRRERLEEERLQEKIKRDQERMRKEYEEEKIQLKQKEAEKRQREEETLQRQKALIQEADDARRKANQERRERLSGPSAPSVEPIQEPPPINNQYPPAPRSPPIPTLRTKQIDASALDSRIQLPLPKEDESRQDEQNVSEVLNDPGVPDEPPDPIDPPNSREPPECVSIPKEPIEMAPSDSNLIPKLEHQGLPTDTTPTNCPNKFSTNENDDPRHVTPRRHSQAMSENPKEGDWNVVETLKLTEKLRKALHREMIRLQRQMNEDSFE